MRKFGLVGEKLGHSFSPGIHAMLSDYEYKLYEIPQEGITEFLTNGDFNGLNVTMPYKKAALTLCRTLSDAAKRIGSVNTVIRQSDGTLFGDNTDYFGFRRLLEKTGVDVSGKKALVFGSGGASAAVNTVLNDCGAGEIVTVSRKGPDNYGNIANHSDAAVIVNTTPVGMYPYNGATPAALSVFVSCEAVLDVVYNPVKTELILQAEDMGVLCAGGLYMLVAQAKRACELFAGIDLPDALIEDVSAAIELEMKNVALIGMPGCGKTTVGKRLAELSNREFHDTDAIVEANAGKSIDRIFAEDGEAAFRDLEEAALREISKQSGRVIATGGGIVNRAANRRSLRQNSVVVFLDRAPGELPTEGRPLSVSRGADALYRERAPLYLKWRDKIITTGGGVEQTARAVYDTIFSGSR